MDTHKKLMISVIVLAVVHAVLSGIVLIKQNTISSYNLKVFLIVSLLVCLLIAALSVYCMQMA